MAEKIVKDSQGLAKELVNDCISRKAAIDEVINLWADKPFGNPALVEIKDCIEKLPSAQPEVIRCKDCKHWTQSVGKMKGYGLGRCDFHDADLVTCNGFCYWAERRTDE